VAIVVGYIISIMSAIKIFSESEHEEVALLGWKACSICRVCGESLSDGVNYAVCCGTFLFSEGSGTSLPFMT
jgi:hypothetical protein